MSALATQSQLVTVTLGWREPNGQVIQFGDGGSPAPAAPAAASSSGSSSSSDQGSQGGSAHGASLVDLFA